MNESKEIREDETIVESTVLLDDDQPKSRMEMYRRLAPAAWKETVDEIITDRNLSKRP